MCVVVFDFRCVTFTVSFSPSVKKPNNVTPIHLEPAPKEEGPPMEQI